MATSSVLSEMCCICQEDYTSPQSELDLSRVNSCPDHWFHWDCLSGWLRSQLTCPVCLTECSHAVDQSGKVITEAEVGAVNNPEDALEDSEEVEEVINLEDLPDEDEEVNPIVQQLQFLLISEALTQFLRAQRPCRLCLSDFSLEMVVVEPCQHRFHDRCLRRVIENTSIFHCPAPHCRQPIAAIVGLPSGVVLYYDRRRLSHPRYAELQARVGLAAAPAAAPTPCPLCGEVRPSLARVQPANCPPAHIVHEACLQRRAGAAPIRHCPVEGCGRQFSAVTRLPPVQRSEERRHPRVSAAPESSWVATPPRMAGDCCECRRPVPMLDGVRPSSCRHLFHRPCLVRVTNHNKVCPVRRCKKKFRSIEEI